MSRHNEFASSEDEDEEHQNDDALDLESIRQACLPQLAADSDDLQLARDIHSRFAGSADIEARGSDSDSDLELARGIQTQFGGSDMEEMMPLSTLPPENDSDDEDEFYTLQAIMRRFSVYDKDSVENGMGIAFGESEQVGASSIASEKEIPSNLFVNRTNASKESPVSVDVRNAAQTATENVEAQNLALIECHQPDAPKSPTFSFEHSNFPKSAHIFIDAIKKNRGYQKFLRSKLGHIEAKIEENKDLMKRIKVLRDFQISCRRKTGRMFSQKTDPRVQLILVQRSKPSKDTKTKEGKMPANFYGPLENSHVANYRMALTRFPVSLNRDKWSDAEKEKLGQGIRQQFQATMLEHLKQCHSEDPQKNLNYIDEIFASVRDFDITPELLREFLPRVNWDQVASLYVPGRTAAECEARWLNWEDSLVNYNPWTVEEDKNLLAVVQEKGLNNWFSVAALLGTGRTPFQCLARYQRSLNACIMKSEWTKEEDSQLRIAVEAYGESDWQTVASTIEGRTGTQCSNRWKKTLNPARQRVGRWAQDEDKRLKVAVTLFGPKNWNRIAGFVPGRTQVQCRERWVNCLDPSLKLGVWTEEEDLKLKDAIAEHGYCWSKIAACVPPRTDNQCRRRWKVLCPDEVPLLQQAKRIQKLAFISNFVDRESDRPALGPNDFNTLPILSSETQTEKVVSSKTRQRSQSASKVKRARRKVQGSSVEVLDNTSCSCPENAESRSMGNGKEVCGNNSVVIEKKKAPKRRTRVTKKGEGQNSSLSSEFLSEITSCEPLSDNLQSSDSNLLITEGPRVDEVSAVERTSDEVVPKPKLKTRKAKLAVSRQKSKDICVDRTSSDKKRSASASRLRKTRTGQFGNQQGCATASTNDVHNNFPKKRKLEVAKTADLDGRPSSDGTEFDFCSRGPEERRQSLSPLENAEDQVPLASFLTSKSKKRKLDISNISDQVCPRPYVEDGYEILNNEAEEHHNGNQLRCNNDVESGTVSLVNDIGSAADNKPGKKQVCS